MKLADGSLPSAGVLAQSLVTLAFVSPRTRLAADASFTFADLEPTTYSLSLLVPGFEPIEREVRVEAGRTSRLELELARGVTVSGWVVDEHGAPLPQSRVSVESKYEDERGSGSIGFSDEVDAQGRFSFEGVRRGEVEVRSQCEGLHAAEVSLGKLAAGESRSGVELVLSAGNRLGGRILSSAQLPSGSVELLIFDETGKDEHETRSGDTGDFLVTGLGSGPFQVWGWSADDAQSVLALGSLARVAANTLDVELRLDPPGSVELAIRGRTSAPEPIVTVVDLEGKPLGVRPDPFNDGWRPRPRMRPTDDGVALDDLPPGDCWLLVTEEGIETRVGRVHATIPAGESIRAEVVLGPACWLVVALLRDGSRLDRGTIRARADDGFCLRFGWDDIEGGGIQSPGGTSLSLGPYTIEAECDGKRATRELTLSAEGVNEVVLVLD